MENSVINTISDALTCCNLKESSHANVEKTERIISVGTGAFIALKGISNLFSSPLLALAELGIGGALLYRGLTGYCPLKDRIDMDIQYNSTNAIL